MVSQEGWLQGWQKVFKWGRVSKLYHQILARESIKITP